MLAQKFEGLVCASGVELEHVTALLIDKLRAVLAAPHHDGFALKASLGNLSNAR